MGQAFTTGLIAAFLWGFFDHRLRLVGWHWVAGPVLVCGVGRFLWLVTPSEFCGVVAALGILAFFRWNDLVNRAFWDQWLVATWQPLVWSDRPR